MTPDELQQLRREKWRLNGNPVRALDEARDFIDSVGFCLMYPLQPPVLLPTFAGAWNGDDKDLHRARQAFADPGTHEAGELINQLLQNHLVFESNLFAESTLLLSPRVLPYFYALMGPRTPGKEQAGGDPLSHSGRLAWNIFQHEGPLSRDQLQRRLGSDLSLSGVDRALGELWMRLHIVPIDQSKGGLWEALQRWEPDAVREGSRMAAASALSALISQYLECVVAAEQSELDDLFSHLVPRSKVKESVNAMLAARQFGFVNVEHHALLQVAAPHVPREPQQQSEIDAHRAARQQRRGKSERRQA
jgi:23S rRNA pseudouridine2605 synthase